MYHEFSATPFFPTNSLRVFSESAYVIDTFTWCRYYHSPTKTYSSSSSWSRWQRLVVNGKLGFVGTNHPEMSYLPCILPEISSLGNRRNVNSTPTAHAFFSCSFCPSLLSTIVQSYRHWLHALTPHIRVAMTFGRLNGVLQFSFRRECHFSSMSIILTFSSHQHVNLCVFLRYDHIWVALWLSAHLAQVVKPSNSLKVKITSIPPKTKKHCSNS